MPTWWSKKPNNKNTKTQQQQQQHQTNGNSNTTLNFNKSPINKVKKNAEKPKSFDEVTGAAFLSRNSPRVSKDFTSYGGAVVDVDGGDKIGLPLPRPCVSSSFSNEQGLVFGSGSFSAGSSVSSSGSIDDHSISQINASRQVDMKFNVRPKSPGPVSRGPTSPTSPLHSRLNALSLDSPTSRQEDGRSQCHPLPLPPGSPTSPSSLSNTRANGQLENNTSNRGKWKKGKLLGRGTFGHVYQGFHSKKPNNKNTKTQQQQQQHQTNGNSNTTLNFNKSPINKVKKNAEKPKSFDEVTGAAFLSRNSPRVSKDFTSYGGAVVDVDGGDKIGLPLPRPCVSSSFSNEQGLVFGSGSFSAGSSVSSSGSIDDHSISQINASRRQVDMKFNVRPKSPGPVSRGPTSPTSPLHSRLNALSLDSPTSRQEDGRSQCHPLPLPPGSPTSPSSLSNTRANGQLENNTSNRGKWKKGKLLGRGTFGHVYQGFHSETGQMCAIKEVRLVCDDQSSKECLKQLNQEINLLSQLSHPNIVQYYGSDLGEEALSVYLEFVSGGSIHKLLQEYGPFGEPVIQNYTRQIVSGLSYLHGRNTLHRDIKGANILVDPNGEIKLADFGMAKHVVMNTNGYSLPVDIWSLGCTILEMAMGKPPWNQYEGVAAFIDMYLTCLQGEEALSVYLEFVSGGSIHKLLQEYGPFGEPVIQNYTRQIVSGLSYLHGRNTLHRDIKGANILVDPNGEIKLADFGMAKHINSSASMLSFKGSPYWMAPEVVMNTNGYSLPVDIWSLGCTILEMAMGKPPWNQYEGVAAIFKIGNSKDMPEIPEHLSNDAKNFIKLCLQRDPLARPTAQMLLDHPFIRDQSATKSVNVRITRDAFPYMLDGSRTPPVLEHNSNSNRTNNTLINGDYATKQVVASSRAVKSTRDSTRMITSLPVSPCSSPLRQYGPAHKSCFFSPHHPSYTMMGQNNLNSYPLRSNAAFTLEPWQEKSLYRAHTPPGGSPRTRLI
ncbi:hypothetical protein TanjilG_26723 [Lupinus angustifolius]|uniref:mitogen-activated protein kinase kinase kinase n=1 Tax=Lupinus angustifolius TaxID=3871 RepID=A0A1J7HRE7_LUPAN|nr:hypothetical protein TanjilG_26723 [Lupinus angustifolius]